MAHLWHGRVGRGPHTLRMELQAILKAAGAVLASFGGPVALMKLVSLVFPHPTTNLRRDITRNVDLLDRIPDDTQAHALLLAEIEKDVGQLLVTAKESRRDPFGVGLGVSFLVVAAIVGRWALQLANPWNILVWVLCASLALLGLFGTFEGLKAAPRDEKGRIVGEANS